MVRQIIELNQQMQDIPAILRVIAVVLLAFFVLALSGCGSAGPVQQVRRIPPADDMVKLDPLPHQVDPTLGGIFKGYVNAAQRYRECANRLDELQDWVTEGQK